MSATRLVIHPLGVDMIEIGKTISEVVQNCDGVVTLNKLLGMITFEAIFLDGSKAMHCMEDLQQLEEVSHVEKHESP